MELQNGRFYGKPRGTRSSCVATLTETSYARGATVPTHTNQHPFLCLVVAGRLDERFEGTVQPIPEGSVLFHPAKAPHAEDFPWVPARAFNIQPDGAWLARLDNLNLTLPAQQLVAGPASRLRRLRVEHARQALERDETPLSRVALESGFSDQSHLTRTFRRYVGTTPGAYRAACRRS